MGFGRHDRQHLDHPVMHIAARFAHLFLEDGLDTEAPRRHQGFEHERGDALVHGAVAHLQRTGVPAACAEDAHI